MTKFEGLVQIEIHILEYIFINKKFSLMSGLLVDFSCMENV